MTRVILEYDVEGCAFCANLCYDGGMEKKSHIEPGLLPVFRLLTAIRLVFTALSMLGSFRNAAWHSQSPNTYVMWNLADALLLLGYLSWPKLRTWLRRWYLPIGIFIATAGPILLQHWTRVSSGTIDLRDVISTWQQLPFLLIPLVMVAWQYRFGVVLLYCVGSGLLDLFLMRLMIPFGSAWLISMPEGMRGIVLLGIGGVIVNRVIISIVVGFMITRLMKTQRAQRMALLQSNIKLTHYATTLEQLTTSRERNRLARELHDTLAHTLSALAVQLGAVDALWDDTPDEAHALLDNALSTTRTGLTETRRALHDLRASPLEDLGIGLALLALSESVASRNGLEVETDVPESLEALPSAVEQCIYRVAQEALENVSRHAAAKRAVLRLTADDDRITLTVSDDGQGFNPEMVDLEQRLGLRGMRERAEMVGGTLAVESGVGEGTTVTLGITFSAQPSA